ncbi:hypothetical protein [Nocardia blacklockiae]|uniref:hypothetical protein n=1 Tax=Nocardia blacklockiae TaxID=480036 RepID=UPI001893417E|nr:hypothetical protein [Nocardia blacklockiae]MBF6172803.1 hypothetical protein [Nocardia blacklockiae]
MSSDSTDQPSRSAPEPASPVTPPPAERPDEAGSTGTLRTVITAIAAVWLVVAVVAAAWFGVGWARAAWFTDGPRADARDTALDAARQAAINLSSMNPDNVDGSIDLMKSSMTGDMLAQLDQNRDRIKQAAENSKTKIEAKVLGASLNSLDSERDKASALVVLQLTQTAPNVPVQSFRATWTLDMAKAGDVWKTEQANSLGQMVPLNAPAPAAPGQPGTPAPGGEPAPSEAPAPPAQPGS